MNESWSIITISNQVTDIRAFRQTGQNKIKSVYTKIKYSRIIVFHVLFHRCIEQKKLTNIFDFENHP